VAVTRKIFSIFFLQGGKIFSPFTKNFAVTRKIPKIFSYEEKYFRHMPETGWDRLSVLFFVWDLPPKKLKKVGNWSHMFPLVLKHKNLSKNHLKS